MGRKKFADEKRPTQEFQICGTRRGRRTEIPCGDEDQEKADYVESVLLRIGMRRSDDQEGDLPALPR